MVQSLPDIAPVRALGRIARRYVFLDCCGQIHKLSKRALKGNVIMSLFGGAGALRSKWPRGGAFYVKAARIALIATCERLDIRIAGPKAARELRSEGVRLEQIAQQLDAFGNLDPQITCPRNVIAFPRGASKK